MPVFVNGSGGGSGGGFKYPPKEITDMLIKKVDGNYYVTWSDPDDLIVDGKVLSEWKGTLLIKNESRTPVSADDGYVVVDNTTRNRYKVDGYNLGSDAAGWFYRLFPYTKNYVFVGSGNSDYVLDPDQISGGSLEDVPWEAIDYFCKQGNVEDYLSVGNEKSLLLSGDINVIVLMRVAGINHDAVSGYNKNNVSFISSICVGSSKFSDSSVAYPSYTSQGQEISYPDYGANITYKISIIIEYLMDKIYTSIDPKLRSVMKNVNKGSKGYFRGESGFGSVGVEYTNDKIFIPSISEVFSREEVSNIGVVEDVYSVDFWGDSSQYDIFKVASNRVIGFTKGGAAKWWLRNSSSGRRSGYFSPPGYAVTVKYKDVFQGLYVDETGNYGIDLQNIENGIVFGFCI